MLDIHNPKAAMDNATGYPDRSGAPRMPSLPKDVFPVKCAVGQTALTIVGNPTPSNNANCYAYTDGSGVWAGGNALPGLTAATGLVLATSATPFPAASFTQDLVSLISGVSIHVFDLTPDLYRTGTLYFAFSQGGVDQTGMTLNEMSNCPGNVVIPVKSIPKSGAILHVPAPDDDMLEYSTSTKPWNSNSTTITWGIYISGAVDQSSYRFEVYNHINFSGNTLNGFNKNVIPPPVGMSEHYRYSVMEANRAHNNNPAMTIKQKSDHAHGVFRQIRTSAAQLGNDFNRTFSKKNIGKAVEFGKSAYTAASTMASVAAMFAG
jgi:hypothetical protein